MLCGQCGKQIADDSLFCAYCGAEQLLPPEAPCEAVADEAPEPAVPEDAADTGAPPAPYKPSLARVLFGRFVGLVLLGSLLYFCYMLSKHRIVLFAGMTTMLQRAFSGAWALLAAGGLALN